MSVIIYKLEPSTIKKYLPLEKLSTLFLTPIPKQKQIPDSYKK